MKNRKLQLALVSVTSCEGCYVSILNQRENFLALTKKADLKNFRLIEEDLHLANEKYDLTLIEGSPVTKENFETLLNLRKNSKLIYALGSCAHLGGIYHLKNYQDSQKIAQYVYKNEGKYIDNPQIYPIGEVIALDGFIPGCPVNGKEVVSLLLQLLSGIKPKIAQYTVCFECQTRGYECVLQKGDICLGPITLAGCEAVCLKSKQGCWGCRGLVEDAQVANLIKLLKENHNAKEIEDVLEVFGVRDLLE